MGTSRSHFFETNAYWCKKTFPSWTGPSGWLARPLNKSLASCTRSKACSIHVHVSINRLSQFGCCSATAITWFMTSTRWAIERNVNSDPDVMRCEQTDEDVGFLHTNGPKKFRREVRPILQPTTPFPDSGGVKTTKMSTGRCFKNFWWLTSFFVQERVDCGHWKECQPD